MFFRDCIDMRTIKQKSFHRYSIAHFIKCLRKVTEQVDKEVDFSIRAISFQEGDLSEYFQERSQEAMENQNIIKNIKVLVDNVVTQYPYCTIGIYGEINSNMDILSQFNDIISELSLITSNSNDYEEVIERERLFEEAERLYEKINEITSPLKKIMEKRFHSAIDKKESSRSFGLARLLDEYSCSFYYKIYDKKHSIDSLKRIIEIDYPRTLRQVTIQRVETMEDIKERLKNYYQIFMENHKIRNVGVFGAFARGEIDETTIVDMLVEFIEEPNEVSEYTIGLFHDNVAHQLQREVNVLFKHQLNPLDIITITILNEVQYLNLESNN